MLGKMALVSVAALGWNSKGNNSEWAELLAEDARRLSENHRIITVPTDHYLPYHSPHIILEALRVCLQMSHPKSFAMGGESTPSERFSATAV